MLIPAALHQVIPLIRSLLSSSKSESATDEPPAKKRKRGRKSSVCQDAYDELLRELAIDWAYEALCRTVDAAWKVLEPIKLENVYARWLKVLDLIIEDKGGDRFVESKRGKLYREPPNEIESLDDDAAGEEEEDPTDEELIAEMDGDVI